MMSHESNVKKALVHYPKFCQVSFLSARLVPSLSLCFWIEKKIHYWDLFQKTIRTQLGPL